MKCWDFIFKPAVIGFMNEMSLIAEETNVDIEQVRHGIGSDSRIGYDFIYPGCGYGGSCFPKDVKALIHIADNLNVDTPLIESVDRVNNSQKLTLFKKLCKALDGNLDDKCIAVWGLSFKPETDDMRESPSLDIIPILQEKGIKISAFDPVAMNEAKKFLKNIEFAENLENCIQDCDALVILTEWNEFRSLTPDKLTNHMRGNILIDLRNALNPDSFAKSKFSLIQIGRKKTNQ